MEGGWREGREDGGRGGRMEGGWREDGGRMEGGEGGWREDGGRGGRMEGGEGEWREDGGRMEGGWREGREDGGSDTCQMWWYLTSDEGLAVPYNESNHRQATRDFTFDPAGDEEVLLLVEVAVVPGAQIAVLGEDLPGLVWAVQVAHEHIPPADDHLRHRRHRRCTEHTLPRP